jgi:hypothetical protein
MVHSFGHILLYRPFLHYLAEPRNDRPPNPCLLRCAMSCVKMSRFTINRAHKMLRYNSLPPPSWQAVYTVFLSIVTLIFFVATQHGTKGYAAVQKDTEYGIQVLAHMSCGANGSTTCLGVLRVRLDLVPAFNLLTKYSDYLSNCHTLWI